MRESLQLVLVPSFFIFCWLCPIQGASFKAENCEELHSIGSSLLQEGVARLGKLSLIEPESSSANTSANSQYLTSEQASTNANLLENSSIAIETSQANIGVTPNASYSQNSSIAIETSRAKTVVTTKASHSENHSVNETSQANPGVATKASRSINSSFANAMGEAKSGVATKASRSENNSATNETSEAKTGVLAEASHSQNTSVANETSQAKINVIAGSTSPLARSVLNEIVGDDGVLVISLARQPHRFAYTKYQMSLAGIQSTLFPATDPLLASEEELNQGCIGQKPNGAAFSETCYGCAAKREQAIALSHRRALVRAANRSSKWTALLEDDMALVKPEQWDSAFRRAWEKIPPEVKFVRLSWCMIVQDRDDIVQTDIDTGGEFFLTQWMSVTADNATYGPGLCTGGYLVHQDVIPELLGLFPCCAPVDGQYALLQKSIRANGKPWGMDVMVSIEARGSRKYIEAATKDTWLGQHGVMYQNRPAVVELREKLAISSLEKVLTPRNPAA